MWYAILDIRNEVDSMTWLAHGELKDIANAVIDQCCNCNPDGTGYLDFDELDEQGYYYEADAYNALEEAKTVTPELLEDFCFTLSGAYVSVHCLAQGYTAFRKAFMQYDGRNYELEALCLPEELPEAEEKAFAREFEDILFTQEYEGDLAPERKYVTKTE